MESCPFGATEKRITDAYTPWSGIANPRSTSEWSELSEWSEGAECLKEAYYRITDAYTPRSRIDFVDLSSVQQFVQAHCVRLIERVQMTAQQRRSASESSESSELVSVVGAISNEELAISNG